MKILFVTAQLAKGGGQQTQSYRLIKELSKHNETKLITFKVKNYNGLINNPCETEYLGYLSFPKSIFILSKKLKEIGYKYDVIQLLDPYYALPAFYFSGLKKAFLRLGTNPAYDLKERGYSLYSTFYKIFLKVMLKKVHVIVNSKHFEEELSSIRPTFIPNGYTVREFYIKQSKESLRKKFRLPKNKKIIIYTGKIIPRKNLEIVFDIMKDLDDSYIFLILGNINEEHYGDTYYKKLIAAYKDTLHKIIFVDEVNMDVVKYYLKASDMLVFPSKLEGSPNSVLEAMFLGLPVICSNIGAHRSVIIDKKNGYLFKDKNELLKIIKNLDMSVGSKAKYYVKYNHNIINVAGAYSRIYQNERNYS